MFSTNNKQALQYFVYNFIVRKALLIYNDQHDTYISIKVEMDIYKHEQLGIF